MKKDFYIKNYEENFISDISSNTEIKNVINLKSGSNFGKIGSIGQRGIPGEAGEGINRAYVYTQNVNGNPNVAVTGSLNLGNIIIKSGDFSIDSGIRLVINEEGLYIFSLNIDYNFLAPIASANSVETVAFSLALTPFGTLYLNDFVTIPAVTGSTIIGSTVSYTQLITTTTLPFTIQIGITSALPVNPLNIYQIDISLIKVEESIGNICNN